MATYILAPISYYSEFYSNSIIANNVEEIHHKKNGIQNKGKENHGGMS